MAGLPNRHFACTKGFSFQSGVSQSSLRSIRTFNNLNDSMSSRTKTLAPLCLSLVAWTALAQTGSGVVRFVDGVAYYPQKDPRWQNRVGECDKILPDGIVVRELPESHSIGVYVSPLLSGPRGARAYGSSFLIKNYSEKISPQVGHGGLGLRDSGIFAKPFKQA